MLKYRYFYLDFQGSSVEHPLTAYKSMKTSTKICIIAILNIQNFLNMCSKLFFYTFKIC